MKDFTYERLGAIGLLTVKRPEVLNALNTEALEQLEMFLELVSKGRQVKVLIITGSGEKSFISGADIQEMNSGTPDSLLRFFELGQAVLNTLEQAPFVTIAAVNGYALGAGFELALACDLIYAAPHAKLGFPEVSLGLIPGFGGTQRLPRVLGLNLAKELVLTGKTISADEALTLGLINRIIPENLLEECYQIAEQIAKNPSFAVLQAKRALNQAASLGQGEGLVAERNMAALCFANDTCRNKLDAFVHRK